MRWTWCWVQTQQRLRALSMLWLAQKGMQCVSSPYDCISQTMLPRPGLWELLP